MNGWKQPWYWYCRTNMIMSSTRDHVSYMGHPNIDKWHKMKMCFKFSPINPANFARWHSSHSQRWITIMGKRRLSLTTPCLWTRLLIVQRQNCFNCNLHHLKAVRSWTITHHPQIYWQQRASEAIITYFVVYFNEPNNLLHISHAVSCHKHWQIINLRYQYGSVYELPYLFPH